MQVFILSPRGFCAGVVRALNIVEGAIEKYKNDKKIYVKHEIVHNKHVVDYFKNKGVVFIEEISEVKEKDAVVIFSAHGVSQKIEDDCTKYQLETIDATCPLVKKVHNLGKKFEAENTKILLIGHKNHPEIEGTMGRITSSVILIQNTEDAKKLELENSENIAYLTQTTLSIDETAEIIAILKKKFPNIKSSKHSDICYATQNRQNVVKSIINSIDLLIVMGSKNSSNSNRLKDIGTTNGIKAILVEHLSQLDDNIVKNKQKIAITSGASSPEILLNEVVEYLQKKYSAKVEYINKTQENIEFHTPKNLRIKECPLV